MFGIGDFFKRFQGVFAKEILVRNAIKEAILRHTGADIPITSIAFKSGAVILSNVSQSLKSAIYIKKSAIIKDIAEKQNIRYVNDIR